MSNLEALQQMPADEFSTFIEDLLNFDNPFHEIKSNLRLALPFESWRDWLEREAEYDTGE